MPLFILCIVLFLAIAESKKTGKKIKKAQTRKNKEVYLSERSKKFHDKNMNPENARTKLQMIKNFVHGVLDQLQLPDNKIEEKINDSNPKILMSCMTLFKNIAHGNSKVETLFELKDLLKFKEIEDKVKDKNKLIDAEKFIKKYTKKMDKF